MSKLDEAKALLDKYNDKVQDLIKEARLEGFEEGLGQTVKMPSEAQFRKDHKQPVMYGEDYCYVVACRSKKTAAKLLETDEDMVEEIGVGWKAYERDGELTIGYYMGRSVEPHWYAWGVYC